MNYIHYPLRSPSDFESNFLNRQRFYSIQVLNIQDYSSFPPKPASSFNAGITRHKLVVITDYIGATWISTEEDSVFQSWHINKLLKEQIECLLKEEEIIEANIRDVEKDISSMEVELSRIKQAETMKIHLEAELQTAQKTLEEEHVLELEMDLYLRKLEKDNEDFNLRILMLSEESSALMASRKASQNSHRQLQLQIRKLERKLQERILDSTAEDEVFIKMQHQAQELEESIKEYEAVIQVLQNKEKTLQDQLFAAEEEKARNLTLPGNVLNINPKSLLFEIANAEMDESQVDFSSFVVASWHTPGHYISHLPCHLHLPLKSDSDRGLPANITALLDLLLLVLHEAAQPWLVASVIPVCRNCPTNSSMPTEKPCQSTTLWSLK
ncbi:uncharacterized protein LOC132243208 [Alligator mississippiensis]|uniref:uncharacterized protein LOC132243208 n=1 Tax=Alligator mississippiensis TaxID=8496 RepID=UPI002877A965|nr:uncharacterized protein LOC132243208 [Alligator mississippiensis]